MILTRQQAIAEHRKMWRWIAEEIEKEKKFFCITFLQQKYLGECTNFFLCENFFDCDNCSHDPSIDKEYLDGLLYKVYHAETWQEQAALARQIAELPEREDV